MRLRSAADRQGKKGKNEQKNEGKKEGKKKG